MRITEIFFQFLIEHRELKLPNIGVIRLKTSIPSDEMDDNQPIPEGYLDFTADPNTPYEDALIIAIAKGTGKIKALASSDLESTIINGIQMMNISKPFIIDRIGTIEKNYKGEVQLIPATNHSGYNAMPNKEIRFDDNYLLRFKKIGYQYKKLIAPMAGLIFLFLIFWFGYYFFKKPITTDETAIQVKPVLSTQKTSTSPLPQKNDTKSVPDSFFLTISKLPKEKAFIRYEDLKKWGHNVSLFTSDSTTFHIRIPIYASLADSSRHKDSLARFFGKQVWVETN